MPNTIAVVAEDKLTQAVLHKCIADFLPDFSIARTEVKGGRGNVQRELGAYVHLAQVMPVLIGVDLDSDECAPTLIADWKARYGTHQSLIIRVAVCEIESWVIADCKRIAKLINAKSDDITKTPDDLADPKNYFLEAVQATAPADMRNDLIPRNYNRYPRIGPAYNIQMCKFVEQRWRPHVAMKRSDSLARAVTAIQNLAN